MSVRYDFTAKLWRSPGAAGWHFVTLPVDMSAQIRAIAGGLLNSFGTLRIVATIGATSWKTSLFADTKKNAFVLPVKADVRRKEGIGHDDEVAVSVELDL